MRDYVSNFYCIQRTDIINRLEQSLTLDNGAQSEIQELTTQKIRGDHFEIFATGRLITDSIARFWIPNHSKNIRAEKIHVVSRILFLVHVHTRSQDDHEARNKTKVRA